MSDALHDQPEPPQPPESPRRFQLTTLGLLIVLVSIVLLTAWLLTRPQQISRRGLIGEARRSQCKNNLTQIGLALHNYHDAFNSLPPPYVADAKGRPMHSWRVLILPFLGQEALYNEYRFHEPWDGPHNKLLADKGADLFRCPSDAPENATPAGPTTSYVAVIGPQTMWPGDRAVNFRDVTDGLSNTLLVVEARNSGIPWMEPRDFHVSQMAPTINSQSGQGISSNHVGGAHVLMGDGSARLLSDTLSLETIRALLTRDGGEVVGDF